MDHDRAVKLTEDAIKDLLDKDPGEYAPFSTYTELGANSLDVVSVIMHIERQLDGVEINNVDLNNLSTVEDLVKLLERRY